MIHIYFNNYYENLKSSVHIFDNKVTFFINIKAFVFVVIAGRKLWRVSARQVHIIFEELWFRKRKIDMYFVIFWKLNLCILIRMHNMVKVFLKFKIFSKPSRLKRFSVLFVQMLCPDMLVSKFKQNIVKKYEHKYKNTTPRCEETFWFLSFFRDLSNVRRPLRKNGFLNVAARAAQTPQVRPCPFI